MLLFATLSVKAQDNAKSKAKKEADKNATAELVLGLPKVSEKNLFTITGTTEKINGLIFIQFCESQKVALFKYNKEIYSKPEDIIKAFEERNVIMPMMVKEGGFMEVKEMCAQ